jgi:chondroitin 4-sulfotransferase 11
MGSKKNAIEKQEKIPVPDTSHVAESRSKNPPEKNFQNAIISCESRNFLYMKIAKVAGTSILRNVLEKEINDVIHKKDHKMEFDIWYENITKERLDRYFSFTFVRNPWDKIVSLYHHFKVKESFKQFVLDGKSKYKRSMIAHSLPQYHYIEFTPLDFVGRYENLEEDWKFVANKIGVCNKLPHINKSNHKHYTEYYDDETIEVIRNEYKKDIELLGYDYEK